VGATPGVCGLPAAAAVGSLDFARVDVARVTELLRRQANLKDLKSVFCSSLVCARLHVRQNMSQQQPRVNITGKLTLY
jgi:hypothetical protein